MTSFVKIVHDILNEENVAGSGGPLGTFDAHGPGVNFNYSAGDHRLPYPDPHMRRRTLNSGENITGIGGKKRYGVRKKSKRRKQK
jgi:hypothetical protein